MSADDLDPDEREELEKEYKAMLRPAIVRLAQVLLDGEEAQRILRGLPVSRSEMLDQMEREMPGVLGRYQPESLSQTARTFQLELALEVIDELRAAPKTTP